MYNTKSVKVSVIDVSQFWISVLVKKNNVSYVVFLVYVKPSCELNVVLESLYVVMDEAMEKFSDLPVIIGGDFNARVGNLGDLSEDLFVGSLLHPDRTAKDSVINKREELLQAFMEDQGFVLINGRTSSDRPSGITFLSHNGSSTIYLIWINAADIASVVDLKIEVDSNLSNHFPVAMELYCCSKVVFQTDQSGYVGQPEMCT